MSTTYYTVVVQITISDGVEYSTSEYEYRKKLRVRVRVLILKNVLEYEYRKKVRVRVLLQVKQTKFLSCNSSKFVAKT